MRASKARRIWRPLIQGAVPGLIRRFSDLGLKPNIEATTLERYSSQVIRNFESTDIHLEWPFLFPARTAMDVGTAPESPPGASA